MAIDFSDYISITDNSVVEIDEKGIRYKALKGTAFIDFSACAHNYQSLHGGIGKCVGEIDKTGSNYSLVFYTDPLTTHVFFMEEGGLMESELEKMVDKITQLGYALTAEIAKRVQEIDSGAVQLVPWSQARKMIAEK